MSSVLASRSLLSSWPVIVLHVGVLLCKGRCLGVLGAWVSEMFLCSVARQIKIKDPAEPIDFQAIFGKVLFWAIFGSWMAEPHA